MTQKPLTASNSPSQYSGGITLKSKEELNLMHEAGIIVGTVLGNLKLYAEVGMTTQELDDIAEKKITRRNMIALALLLLWAKLGMHLI